MAKNGAGTQRIVDFARLAPELFTALERIDDAVRRGLPDQRLLELVKVRTSQINGCAFCLAAHSRMALKAGETRERIFQLDGWRGSSAFSERERAALSLAESLTRIEAAGIPDEAYAMAAKHFSERELVYLALAICSINTWNRLYITFGGNPRMV
ncbi:MAG: carboxymuconolactone decarboxylase family protein [Candidatus Marsarchaeota archaeon]|jgi:AhpD family alkylhydroperoxidase|nr:carboxymuconolactone decarboxylase family protein [Candidatus Marsarchaeota archaeon]